MLTAFVSDILKIIQILIIPGMYLSYRSLKKNINNQRDLKDMKTYVILLCEKQGITCTLEKLS